MSMDRITGLLLIEVRNSNPNGDPDRESDPRQRADGRGEISPVSVKRKLRDLVENKEGPVWQEVGKHLDADRFHILESRGRRRDKIEDEIVKDGAKKFVAKYWDGRVFGNTFLEKESVIKERHPKASKEEIHKIGMAMGANIRTGVAQFALGVSIAPVRIERKTMTSKAGVEEGIDRGMAPLAFRIVEHGLYEMPFFVNPSTADRSGCKSEDIELLLTRLRGFER
jgi:Cas7 group CRISPR-associated protein Csh2